MGVVEDFEASGFLLFAVEQVSAKTKKSVSIIRSSKNGAPRPDTFQLT